MDINDVVLQMKKDIENAICLGEFNGKEYPNGQKAKEALIRSQKLINLLHEWVKYELLDTGVLPKLIFPPIGHSKPERKIAGYLKEKDQDVCIVPLENLISKKARSIDWGPLRHTNKKDENGHEYNEKTLVVNVRSQLSSIAKNTDTLFERTFAEAMNLHTVYPEMVLGEVYLIPVYEYDDKSMEKNTIRFKNKQTNLEKYISFFDAISHRELTQGEDYKYERSALIIVDFSTEIPKVYKSTQELKNDGLVSDDYSIEFEGLSFNNFGNDIIKIYQNRFGGKQLGL